ncbi:MAG: MlaE family ABC transporter permease, partial [Wenzhouxiangella sp.]
MTDAQAWLSGGEGGHAPLALIGDWRIHHAAELKRALDGLEGEWDRLDGSGIEALDAAGAFLLLDLARRLGVDVESIRLAAHQRELVAAVADRLAVEEPAPEPVPGLWRRVLAGLGRATLALKNNALQLLGFLGLALATLAATAFRPRRWRVTATAHHMQQSGLDALPLVSLLSFLVGAVVAFLGATVLRDFGAELFVVDLTTYAFLRVFGVLLTAILLAGRT